MLVLRTGNSMVNEYACSSRVEVMLKSLNHFLAGCRTPTPVGRGPARPDAALDGRVFLPEARFRDSHLMADDVLYLHLDISNLIPTTRA